jgi:hypothetical protein
MRPVNKAKETVVQPTKAILGGVACLGKIHESTILLRMGKRSHGGGTPDAPITITAIILTMRSTRHAGWQYFSLGKFHHNLLMASVLP